MIVRGGDINASGGIVTGYNNSQGKAAGGIAGAALGGVLLGPLGALAGGVIGKLIGNLFGTRTDVTGSGIYGGAQSLGSVLNGGFNGQAYSDVTKTHKFFGIVSGRSYSTEYGALDPNLSNQFTLILRSFNDAIKAAAGPLGITEAGPSIGINDFSRKVTDDFGVTTVAERSWAKKMTIRSLIETRAVDGIQRTVAGLRARPALWIGEDGFDSLTVYGFFKDFSEDLALETISYCSLTIEGLI